MKLITMVKLAVPFALVAGIAVFASVYVAGASDLVEDEKFSDHGKRHVSGTDFEVPELEGSASEVFTLVVAPPTELDRRMGVVGPNSTPFPPVFREPDAGNSLLPGTPLPSTSIVGVAPVNQKGTLLPLSPHSSHNVFSVHEGIGVLAEDRQFFEDLNELHISSAWDLSLKLRALEKAQEDIGFPTQKVLVDGTVQCEAFITTEEFYIRSPNYPYNYPPNLTCEYNIYRRAGSCGVELTVLRFDLASPDPVTGYCRDNLRVMGRPFCGRRQRGETALLSFPGLLLSLKLETGPGHGASGLLLQGRQVKDCRETRQLGRPLAPTRQCVSSLQGEKFTLRSPGYPEPYPPNSECSYFIQRRSLKYCGAELLVKNFSVEAASCMFDYIEVGQERICGTKASDTKYYFPFEDSKLSIRFRSDESIARPGFMIEGEQVKCSEVGSREEEYHDPKTLQDFISATAGRINFVSSAATVSDINVKPQDLFDHYNNDDDINYILSLVGRAPLPREGERPSRQHLGRELNTEEGVETTTSPNDVQQEVVTEDGSGAGEVTEAGAVIEGSVELDPTDTSVPTDATPADTTVAPVEETTTKPNIIDVPTPTLSLIGSDENTVGPLGPCDEVFGEESFTLRSPKITGLLPSRVDCSFIIKRSSEDICEIRILLMDLALAPRASSGECEDEFLLIAGNRFCGGDDDKRVRLLQPGSLVRLNLHSDAAQENTGFTARVEQLRGSACYSDQPVIPAAMNCDVTLSDEISTIFSPLYPGPYPENSNCLVTVLKANPSVQSVTLFLEEFNVEESPDCRRDYFAVSSARLCGQRSGETIHFRFPAQELVMEFSSDGLQAASGYRIHVRQNRFHPFNPIPFGSSGHHPYPSSPGSLYPSSTLSPPPQQGVPLPLATGGGPPTTFTPSKVIVGGPGPTVTLRPPSLPEVATDIPTITECGDETRRREVIIKSPGFPKSPPKNLHCTYKIEKISNDVCQLKIQIHELKLGGRTDCGRSFLQIGAQQRLCGEQRGSDIRTYHFTDDVMELNFHTGPDEREGGFYITVQQTPCGHFEPIGTFSNLQTISGVQVVTGPSISLISTQVTTEPTTKPIIQSNFGAIIDTSEHFNGHNYHNYPTFPPLRPTTEPLTTPSTTYYPKEYNLITPSPYPAPHYQDDQHFVYYYIPGNQFQRPKPRPQQQLRPQHKQPQKQQQAKPGKQRPLHKQPQASTGKGHGGFMHNMKSKYEKMKKMFYQDGNNNKGSVEVEGEVHYVRPRPSQPTVAYSPLPRHPRRPTIPRQVQFTSGRPQRYQFVRNPYFRPREVEEKKPTPAVRFRYPQVYSPASRPVVTTNQLPGFRQQNTFIVIPTGPAQQGVPPGDYNVVAQLHPQQTITVRPSLYTAAPRPVYATTPRPVFFATRRPTLVSTPRPVIRVTTPQPILTVTSPRPFVTSTQVPASPSTSFFPPTPTPAVVRYQNPPFGQGSGPVAGYNAFIVTGTPGWVHGRASENRGKQLQESSEDDPLLGSASVASSVTVNDCGRVIYEKEFYIRSPELVSPESIGDDQGYCTYTIAKSGPDRCSLVLEVQDFKQVGQCVDDNSLRCDPAAHMLTRFTPDGDLLLQFNRTVDSSTGGAVFTVHGRQQLCTDSITVTTAAPEAAPGEGRSPKQRPINWQEPVSTALPPVVVGRTSEATPEFVRTNAPTTVLSITTTPEVGGIGDGWKVINPLRWVGSGGREREARKIIEHGGKIVKKLRSSENGLRGGK